MGSLVRHIAAMTDAKYGVNILEVDQPASVIGQLSAAVCVVADLPWGPPDVVTEITSSAELFATFAPTEFASAHDNYDALKAFMNKSFPGGLKVVRIDATSAAKATKTFVDDDATPEPSVIVTAKYKGALGNNIKVAWAAGSSGSKRTATVSIGTTYSATYIDVVDGIVVTDPGDPFVTFAAHGSANEPPVVVAATSLTGGSDGVAVAADYTGTDPNSRGIRAFYAAEVDVGVLCVAECPSGLIDTVNDGLLAFAADCDKGFVVLCTVESQTYSAAQTYVADYRDTDGRLAYAWPKVYTPNRFDADADEVLVDGNLFAAAAIVSVPAEQSPGGAAGAEALAGITRLEQSVTDAAYEALNTAGIVPFFMSTALGGAILRRGVTTSQTTGRKKIFRRRMTDEIVQSIAGLLEQYIERPLDLTLSPRNLGPVTSAELGAIRSYLEQLKTTDKRIENYSVDEFSGNTQAGLDDGTFVILITVKLFAMQEEIVLKATIGESVTITVQA